MLAGVSLGALFALALTLPLDVADNPRDVGAVTAIMLGAGYVMTSAAPTLLGLVRDTTDSFRWVLWALLAITCVLSVCCLALSPRRVQAGVWP